MLPLPPLNFNGGAAYGGTAGGASPFTPEGDWNLNLGGSGPSLQGAASGLSPLLIVAVVAGAAWLLLRK